jgi:hypothetical protein
MNTLIDCRYIGKLYRERGPLYRPVLPLLRSVAQLVRAPVSKTGGWGFESLHSCQAAVAPFYLLTVAAAGSTKPAIARGP